MAEISRLLAAFTILAVSMPSLAGQLSVRLEPPTLFKRASGITSWDVFLDGEIDTGAPERVKRELARLADAGANIYLDSSGGSLFAGLELGRLIRKFGATTDIGKRVEGASEVRPGKCLSACSLAFLGGTYRYMLRGSIYGVHRVSSTTGPSAGDLDVGQILSAAISNFIRDMGVDAGLFDRMVQAGRDEIYVLSPAEATTLQVVTNGRKPAEWSIETVEGLLYLRGAQETVSGMGKALFICQKGIFLLHSIYEAGPIAARLAAGGWVHSLMIDGTTVPLPNPSRLENDNGFVNAVFPLTSDQVRLIYSANSVGHAMQVARDAPTFIGYRIAIDRASAKRVRGFIDSCANRD